MSTPGTFDERSHTRKRSINPLRAGSAEAALASTPTPGPRTAMRRSDRAVAVMAKRTPWILRAMARLTPATGRSSIPLATSASKE